MLVIIRFGRVVSVGFAASFADKVKAFAERLASTPYGEPRALTVDNAVVGLEVAGVPSSDLPQLERHLHTSAQQSRLPDFSIVIEEDT